MSDEDALLAGIAAAPADPLPRLVFADWLDDHARAVEAEVVRLGEGLFAGSGTDGDRAWFRALAAARDPRRLAQVVRPEVARCGLRLVVDCPKRWADIAPTADLDRRHCGQCDRPVFLCTTLAAATDRALAGECVALDRRLVRPDALPRPGTYLSVESGGQLEFTDPPAHDPPS